MPEVCPKCNCTDTECTNTGYGDSQTWYCFQCDKLFEIKMEEGF